MTKLNKKFRITFNAPVTLTFALICFAVTLIGWLTGGLSTKLLFMTYHSPLTDPLTYLRFFTHVIGHNSWTHFMNNASYLLLLGPMLEEKHGSSEILEIILITALATGLVNYILFWDVMLCGASGVVFAFILLASFTGFKDGEIPLSFILVVLIYLGQQVLAGIFINDNISNTAHIVGGLVGAVMGYILNKKK